MPKISVHTGNENKIFHVPEGISLSDALKRQGFLLETPCNGKGICGKCRVLIHNSVPYTSEEKTHLSPSDINKGVHLSCMVKVYDNLEISLNTDQRNSSIVTDANISETIGRPVVRKTFVNLPRPSISDQRSDDVRFISSLMKIICTAVFRVFPFPFSGNFPIS